MSNVYEEAELSKKAIRMHDCGNTLKFVKLPDSDRLKFYQAYFCKLRLCPMCNWRRSLKVSFQTKRIVELINSRKQMGWLFLTLTVKNVYGEDLKPTLDQMTKAWNRFTGYKAFKDVVKGYFRATEITKNTNKDSMSNGTYHPHFHVLLCVNPSYFKSKSYLNHSEWTDLWKRAMQLDYDPIVNVKKVKPKKSTPDFVEVEGKYRKAYTEKSLEGAVLEVAKYPLKDSDIIQEDDPKSTIETVLTLDKALSYKRLLAYGGLLKQAHKELHFDSEDDEDLINIGDETDEVANGVITVMATWHVGIRDYVLHTEDGRPRTD